MGWMMQEAGRICSSKNPLCLPCRLPPFSSLHLVTKGILVCVCRRVASTDVSLPRRKRIIVGGDLLRKTRQDGTEEEEGKREKRKKQRLSAAAWIIDVFLFLGTGYLMYCLTRWDQTCFFCFSSSEDKIYWRKA